MHVVSTRNALPSTTSPEDDIAWLEAVTTGALPITPEAASAAVEIADVDDTLRQWAAEQALTPTEGLVRTASLLLAGTHPHPRWATERVRALQLVMA